MLVHVQKGKESLQHCSIAGMYAYEGHQYCFLQDKIPQNCKEEFPAFARVNSPELQKPL
jgi:hypothetical protein